ncbi:MAG: hypothetical protein RMJ84_11085, partial [Sandaracinaceae bacterium]|nr:hypothetical protein [Sandaracinaceae bacterium]
AFMVVDGGVDVWRPDAFMVVDGGVDAFEAPDAFSPDAYQSPDAFEAPDAFSPDAYQSPDASEGDSGVIERDAQMVRDGGTFRGDGGSDAGRPRPMTQDSGCDCRVGARAGSRPWLLGFGLLCLLAFRRKRR